MVNVNKLKELYEKPFWNVMNGVETKQCSLIDNIVWYFISGYK